MKQFEHEEASGIPYIRMSEENTYKEDEDENELDRRLGSALTAIDHAMQALGMLERVKSQIEQADFLRLARDNFAFALRKLDASDETLQSTSAWAFWHKEALAGLTEAEKQLGKRRLF